MDMILTKEECSINKGLWEQKTSVNLKIRHGLVWLNCRAVWKDTAEELDLNKMSEVPGCPDGGARQLEFVMATPEALKDDCLKGIIAGQFGPQSQEL